MSNPEPEALADRARALVAALRERAELRSLWENVRAAGPELGELAAELCEVPAPTFHEQQRGARVAQWLEAATGGRAESDELGSCWVRLAGARGAGPRLLIAAHLDTVFPPETPVRVRREAERWSGPGLGDNCAGLSQLIVAARLLREAGRPFGGGLLLAADACEEGLGDLRGMKALCQRFGPELDGVLALDGTLGQVVCAGVGSKRYRLSVRGPGGHSWQDFGAPSAVHHLAHVAAGLAGLHVPKEPRATFNIGVIRGGASVNSIAADAELLLDLRSADNAELARLDAQARAVIEGCRCPEKLTRHLECVGTRPTGDPALTREWIELARAALESVGVRANLAASSSDANVPLSLGLRATTLGTRRGGGAHTLDEWIEPASLPLGLEAALLTILAALGLLPRRT
jgi:acetylornithine deacetylase/succinyl-diaminopimelate desuccinylase-like protein